MGLNGAEIVFNPSATVAGLSEYLWKLEQPAHAAAWLFVSASPALRSRCTSSCRSCARWFTSQTATVGLRSFLTSRALSASPCAERVKRMERDGVITGYHARVSPEALGKTLLVFVEIKLSAKSGDVFDKVRQELLHMPEVLECHLVSGSFDYLVKARLSGMSEYRHLLGDILKKLPVAAESHSYVVMEEIKETLMLAVDR